MTERDRKKITALINEAEEGKFFTPNSFKLMEEFKETKDVEERGELELEILVRAMIAECVGKEYLEYNDLASDLYKCIGFSHLEEEKYQEFRRAVEQSCLEVKKISRKDYIREKARELGVLVEKEEKTEKETR